MTKNIIIVGMGPGMSMGLARQFASKGFTIGMISRNAEKLSQFKQEFTKEGISSHFAVADVADTSSLLGAIAQLQKEMGPIAVLNYNANDGRYVHVLEEQVDDLTRGFRISVANALAATQALVPDLTKNKGAVLFTGGGTALHPLADYATISLGKAGIRSLAYMLHDSLKKHGVYVGTLTINGAIDWESPRHSPAMLAEKFWEMFLSRNKVEVVY
jgi:short-subunit dehydrogenase